MCVCRALLSGKPLAKTKSLPSPERPRSLLMSDVQWLEGFRKNLHSSLIHIEERFNRLVNPSLMISSIDEHSKQIQGLLNFIKNVQIACSGIQPSALIEKQNDIRAYINQFTQNFSSEQPVALTSEATQHLTRLLYQLLSILISHIHTYTNAFLIPYEVEIYNDASESIDLQRLDCSVNWLTLTHIRQLFHSFFSFPANSGNNWTPSSHQVIRITDCLRWQPSLHSVQCENSTRQRSCVLWKQNSGE